MKKVLLTQPIHQAGMKLLEGKAEVILAPDPSAETIMKLAADVQGIVLRTTSKITREIIYAAKNLQVISRTGTGVDNVDVAAASERGVKVCNLPGINTSCVAEHTVMLILALAKDIVRMDAAVRRGNWDYRRSGRPIELEGKILGLVGLGHIGRRVAQMCRLGLGMKVIAYDPYVNNKKKMTDGIEICASPEQLFSESDIVSVHVSYSRATHYLINKKLLSIAKPTAYLINTSRGAVIDETALTQAIQEDLLAGAALDVFEKEPPDSVNPLLKMDNVILTPHSAALTEECTARAAAQAAQAVLDVFEGRQPKYFLTSASISTHR